MTWLCCRSLSEISGPDALFFSFILLTEFLCPDSSQRLSVNAGLQSSFPWALCFYPRSVMEKIFRMLLLMCVFILVCRCPLSPCLFTLLPYSFCKWITLSPKLNLCLFAPNSQYTSGTDSNCMSVCLWSNTSFVRTTSLTSTDTYLHHWLLPGYVSI